MRRDVHASHAEHHRLQPLDERHEGGLVALAEEPDQLDVVAGRGDGGVHDAKTSGESKKDDEVSGGTDDPHDRGAVAGDRPVLDLAARTRVTGVDHRATTHVEGDVADRRVEEQQVARLRL